MRLCLVLAIAGLLCSSAAAAADKPLVIPVWNGPAPGSETWTYAEENNTAEPGKPLYISNIVTPTITVYPADETKVTGTGVLVIPGGGFTHLSYGTEGEQLAKWLNSFGVTAFVLKYRLAHTSDEDAKNPEILKSRIQSVIPMASADAKQAMHILRGRAAEWGLKRFGVVGFSAGGLLTVVTALELDAPVRPEFVAPIYARPPDAFTVAASAPPAFIMVADDDPRGSERSLKLYSAWHDAHVPVELHIYAKGGHGFGMRKSGIPTDTWNERLKEWMTLMGFLPKPALPTASQAR